VVECGALSQHVRAEEEEEEEEEEEQEKKKKEKKKKKSLASPPFSLQASVMFLSVHCTLLYSAHPRNCPPAHPTRADEGINNAGILEGNHGSAALGENNSRCVLRFTVSAAKDTCGVGRLCYFPHVATLISSECDKQTASEAGLVDGRVGDGWGQGVLYAIVVVVVVEVVVVVVGVVVVDHNYWVQVHRLEHGDGGILDLDDWDGTLIATPRLHVKVFFDFLLCDNPPPAPLPALPGEEEEEEEEEEEASSGTAANHS
ncbi:hypothetical protein CRUP_014831, partial [Coryphaenoides rupestris]